MILKSLELVGFKSFVEQTHLDFTKGFTAIVGPNGCGKSNVSDAIRWVIGEQNSRLLRGLKLADLIFNGSETRKPVNRAEINLVIGNLPPGLRIANVQNLAEEVKITRCYYRSGESEYYINGIPCRLKDVVDLFLDLGITSRSMTIIEQNQIQDIITSKPEERRHLLEEAAGILKFKHRKHEAQCKLEISRQNLLRLGDIVQELGRRAESLKRQAAKADRYKRFKLEIKELSLNLYVKKIRLYQQELKRVEGEYQRIQEDKSLEAARVSSLDNEVANLKIAIDELKNAVNLKRERMYELASRIGDGEHQIELRRSQIETAAQDSSAATQEISQMQEEVETLSGEAEDRRAELSRVSGEIAAQEENCGRLIQALDQDKILLRQKEETGRAVEERIMELYQRISLKKNETAALQTRKQFLQSQAEKLRGEEEQTRETLEKACRATADAETDYGEKLRRFESLKARQEDLMRQGEACKAKLQEHSERLAAAKDRYLSQHSLLNSIKDLRARFEGFKDGVKSLMAQNGNGGRLRGLRDVLADVLQTPSEYEPAVEAVLGEKLQSVIVNSYADSVEAIGYLKSHRSGRGSFIPIHPKSVPVVPIHLNGNPAVLGKMKDLIQCREEYRPLIEQLLGDVVLVQDLETAMTLHTRPDFRGVVVTRNGEVIDSQGVISGGEGSGGSAGLLARKREMDDLAVQVAALKQELDSLDRLHGELTGQLSGLEENINQIRPAVHEAEIAQANSRKDLEQLKKETERLREKLSVLDYERESANFGELAAEEQALARDTALAEEEKTGEEERLETLRKDLQVFKEALEEKSAQANEVKVAIASLQGRRDILLLDINRLLQQQDSLRRRIEQRERDLQGNAAKIDAHKEEIESREKEVLQCAREKDRLAEELAGEEENLGEKEETLRREEQESRTVSKRVQELTEALSKLDLKRSEIKIQSSHLAEQAFEDFNVSVKEMLSLYDGEVDEAETEEALRTLKDKIAKMGEVNLAAVSEFEQTNERHGFLKRQTDDLAESVRILQTAIETINRTTRRRFLETFHQVDEQFQAIYARLFQGGKAQLVLCDESDPLESGVEISAQPPGKKMQNLSLLSGGEKAMTAIALVFALLKVRPSPFCLLDEVDAPLDELNVVRFQEILKELAGDTQFILITHNQKTMSFANVLYGVTMEEKGVSKVVSVHLN
ncbi:MAG: chromosome segregation protein SMC [Nitrospinales bacterium]